ncbi:unnamed protein product, partial [Didymodactylos carnosus]
MVINALDRTVVNISSTTTCSKVANITTTINASVNNACATETIYIQASNSSQVTMQRSS